MVITGKPIRDIWSAKRAEINIKLAEYYLQYSEKISQAHQPADLTAQVICTINELHDSDGNWDAPKAPMINERHWPKPYDGIDEFSHKCYGITSMLILTATPLTVIRRLRLPSSNPSHWHTK